MGHVPLTWCYLATEELVKEAQRNNILTTVIIIIVNYLAFKCCGKCLHVFPYLIPITAH